MYPRVILNGTMIKKSQQKKITSPENYKERIFVLDTKELTYSERRSKSKPPILRGSIELSKIKCVETVQSDLPIPCPYKYPFQVFYDNSYLYIFAPDDESRQKWVMALKEETQYNDLVTKYHPDMWMDGKWRCCKQTEKLAMGCVKYQLGGLASKKALPLLPNPKMRLYDTDTRIVTAIQDFNPIEKDNLALQKDQKYILIDNTDFDWWTVQDNEGKKGFVPSTYVAGNFETDFDRFEWYNKRITSKEAEDLLTKEGKEGAFMVRDSQKQPGYYSVSVFTKAAVPNGERNPNVRHYLIRQETKEEELAFYLAANKLFCTIPGLIHYHQHDAAGLITRLRHPVSQDHRFSLGVHNYSEDQWELDPLELILEETLGNGQFGLVMGGKWRDKRVAVKMIKEGSMSEEEFKEEAKVMMKLSHCKLVHLYGVCTQRSPMCLVFEFMEKGALVDYLRDRKGRLSKDTLLGICLDVSEGMAYLESSNYLHRDLAARNCLVSKNNKVKVADFGMARFVLDDQYTSSQGSKFPVRWSAPEIIRYAKFSSKSDVWSFGVLMWEVYSEGRLPYENQSNMDVIESLNRGHRLQKPRLAPKDVHVLMEWCWKDKPEDRPTFGQLLHQLAYLADL